MMALVPAFCLPSGIDGVEPMGVTPNRQITKPRASLRKIEQVRVGYRGLTQAARALGCSRAHLSYVLHGKRKPSERLARQLRRMGVEVKG